MVLAKVDFRFSLLLITFDWFLIVVVLYQLIIM